MVEVTCPDCGKTIYCEVVGDIEDACEFSFTCPHCRDLLFFIEHVNIIEFFKKVTKQEFGCADISSLQDVQTNIPVS